MLRDENMVDSLFEDNRLPELVEDVNARWKSEQQLWGEFYEKTKPNDKGIKKEDYASHGAEEYWLVDPDEKTVELYILNTAKKEFELFSKKAVVDHITCQVVTGCTFPNEAIFDEKKKMEVVREWLIILTSLNSKI